MAEILEIHDSSIFDSKSQVIVNPVNCEGVMGKGLALEYKFRFPEMYKHYKSACERELLAPGRLLLYRDATPWIMSFPTKNRWKQPSRLGYIENGLRKLSSTYINKTISSIAFPKLGTAAGGLSWESVRQLIYQHLENLPNLSIEIFHYSPRAHDSLFERLYKDISCFGRDDFKSKCGISPGQADKLVEAIYNETIFSMSDLANVKGIGIRTLEKLYIYAGPNRAENKSIMPGEQLELF